MKFLNDKFDSLFLWSLLCGFMLVMTGNEGFVGLWFAGLLWMYTNWDPDPDPYDKYSKGDPPGYGDGGF